VVSGPQRALLAGKDSGIRYNVLSITDSKTYIA
jgi:hypothetical protein